MLMLRPTTLLPLNNPEDMLLEAAGLTAWSLVSELRSVVCVVLWPAALPFTYSSMSLPLQ